MGFQPQRLTREWDRTRADREAKGFWEIRRTMLLRQADKSFRSGDKEEKDRIIGAIKKFNTDLPKDLPKLRISRDTLTTSMKQRALQRKKRELGVEVSPTVKELYPEAGGAGTISVRPVR